VCIIFVCLNAVDWSVKRWRRRSGGGVRVVVSCVSAACQLVDLLAVSTVLCLLFAVQLCACRCVFIIPIIITIIIIIISIIVIIITPGSQRELCVCG
jgi:hypothetical protein